VLSERFLRYPKSSVSQEPKNGHRSIYMCYGIKTEDRHEIAGSANMNQSNEVSQIGIFPPDILGANTFSADIFAFRYFCTSIVFPPIFLHADIFLLICLHADIFSVASLLGDIFTTVIFSVVIFATDTFNTDIFSPIFLLSIFYPKGAQSANAALAAR
jgi:hypothetical protein